VVAKLWLALLVGVVALTVVRMGDSDAEPIRSTHAAERDNLHLSIRIAQAGGTIAVETEVENRRSEPVFLVPDQCGHVTEALLVRTKLQPEGRTWPGSLQSLKRFVVRQQRSLQGPDTLAPRRPGDGSGAVPECRRPDRVVRMEPGAVIRERWESNPPLDSALDAVGSEHTTIRVELVEARHPGDVEYLDIIPAGEAERVRAGRALRVERPASAVIDHPPRAADPGPSLGQLYDRLLEDPKLRSWIAARPAESWRTGDMQTYGPELRFTAVTRQYEKAATVRARPDASQPRVELPGPRDRTRRFRSRAAALPAGVELVPERSRYTPTRDLIAGRLALPSGRVVIDEFPSERSRPLEYRFAPGRYPAYVTLARRKGRDPGFEGVALATLVVSGEKPLRWRRIGGIGVDSATGAFTSVEGARRLEPLLATEPDSGGYHDRMFQSLTAHDNQVTEFPIEGDLNQVRFSTGASDGGYPLLAGLDREGRPARFVLDFYLLHLAWPGRLKSPDGR